MKQTLLILLFFTSLLSSCSKDDDTIIDSKNDLKGLWVGEWESMLFENNKFTKYNSPDPSTHTKSEVYNYIIPSEGKIRYWMGAKTDTITQNYRIEKSTTENTVLILFMNDFVYVRK